MKKIFISGSRKISKLNKEVLDFLKDILDKNMHIMVGDASGVDKAVQKILSDNNYENVTVYFSGVRPRNKLANWDERMVKTAAKKRTYEYYAAKDRIMASECDEGFAIWDGKSKGTFENIMKLLSNNKKVTIYYSPEKRFVYLEKPEEAEWIVKTYEKAGKEYKPDVTGLNEDVSQKQTSFDFSKKNLK